MLPLGDGRVLIRRRVADRHDLALLYPTGPGTGELPVCSLGGTEVKLLPPAPLPGTAFALAYEDGVTTVWQVYGHGTPDGSPVAVMSVAGRCTGGVWLDRTGRLLALDRELDGRTKAIAADLHTAETSPLLQLTEESDDRLLLAAPDSGLLLLRSDATGEARIGWGVLGSRHPVRFPDALRVPGALFTPVVAQPGQILSPRRPWWRCGPRCPAVRSRWRCGGRASGRCTGGPPRAAGSGRPRSGCRATNCAFRTPFRTGRAA